MRPNSNLLKATLTGALGGLLFGFDTVVISGALDALVKLYHLSDLGKGWTVAIALIGTVAGSFSAGVAGQKLGGRETLLLIGAAGTAACLAGVAWIFSTNSHQGTLVWLLIVYIAFFALSQGAVIWVYIGEVFPNHVRSKGQGIGNASHWIMNTCIALVFPLVAAQMGRGTPFVFFAAMTAVQFVVVLLTFPETKGQTLEDLQRKLVRS